MNALTRDLIKLVDMTEEMMKEKEQKEGADYREKLHLMPPVGWLNDPNGLCQLNGIYHAFFQYSPFNAEGGVKMWGHYTSKDDFSKVEKTAAGTVTTADLAMKIEK